MRALEGGLELLGPVFTTEDTRLGMDVWPPIFLLSVRHQKKVMIQPIKPRRRLIQKYLAQEKPLFLA